MEGTREAASPSSATGQRFEFNAAERRCLELLLAPVERLRAEAARIELAALLEVRALVLDRLGLPRDSQVKILRREGRAVGLELLQTSAEASG